MSDSDYKPSYVLTERVVDLMERIGEARKLGETGWKRCPTLVRRGAVG